MNPIQVFNVCRWSIFCSRPKPQISLALLMNILHRTILRCALKRTRSPYFDIPLLIAFVICTDLFFASSTLAGPTIRTSQQSTVLYTCPMDPEVRSTVPGKCRKCGMALKQTPLEGADISNNINGDGRIPDTLRIPDEWVFDQSGKKLRFYTDLVKNQTVAIEFIFTSCTTICPPLTATLRRVQQQLGDSQLNKIQLISISVDPDTDVPERLQAFSSKFNAGPGWSFITGGKQEITRILKALGANTSDKNQHSPTVVIGNDRAGYWTRAYGLASPATLVRVINEAASQSAPSKTVNEGAVGTQPATVKTPGEAAASYFPNVSLLTQDNKQVHFFSDLLKGKIVLINFVFTTCTGVCPTMTTNLRKVQDLLGDRVGKDMNMISISVDPEVDTPEALKKYAASFGVKPGWYFLTGPRTELDQVLRKLGGFVADKNDHTNLLIVGNVESGNWIKVFALARPAEIAAEVVKLANPE
jgi:protein SCO1